MIQDDPYTSMIEIFRRDTREQSAWPWRFGTILSLSPLTVDIAGEKITAGLWVNPLLLGRMSAGELSGLTGSLQSPGGTVSVTGGSLAGNVSLAGVLAAGDRVVLLESEDGQEFVILCKAVGT